MASIKTVGSLDRQDAILTFGSTGTLSTSAVPFGYTASFTDGVRIDTGDTDLEGMTVVINTEEAITASGSPSATAVVIEMKAYDSAGSSVTVFKQTFASTDFVVGKPVTIGIPRNYGNKTILALTADVDFTGGTTPAVTAGKLYAYIDCYQGAV